MTLPAAGWYPDPEDSTRSRWWDGDQWTDHRSSFQAMPMPVEYSMAQATPEALTAPAGTRWNTVWIWLIVALPFVSSLGLLTVDWSGIFDFTRLANSPSNGMSMMLPIMTSPGYLFSIFGGWIAYGLGVWFAYLDWNELKRRGVPRPFHWAFNFIPYPVYVIGRSVVVRRRTGKGISPMWVTIAAYIVFIIGMVVFFFYIFSMMISQIALYSDNPGLLTP